MKLPRCQKKKNRLKKKNLEQNSSKLNLTERRLLLGRKAMTNLGSILKSRDIILPAKIRLVKAMVFLIVKYGCESWTIKKDEH